MNGQPLPAGAVDLPRHGIAWGWVLLSFAIQLGAVLPLLFSLLCVVPKFEAIFKDLCTALPVLTQVVIQVGRIFRHVLAIPPLLALLFLASAGLGARRLHPALLWGWTAVVVAGAAIAAAAVIVGLFSPLLVIIQSLK